MMRTVSLFCLMLFSSAALAGPTFKEPNQQKVNVINKTLEENIGLENTCTDEYMVRRRFIRKRLIYTPIAGTVATPVAGVAGGVALGYGVTLVGVSGWSALGYMIIGTFAAGAAVAVTALYKEGKYVFKSISVNRMLNLIAESRNSMERGYISNKYLRVYKSWYKDDRKISLKEFQDIIVDLDSTGALCDGTVTNRPNGKYLSSRLTLRNSLLKYIHKYRMNL